MGEKISLLNYEGVILVDWMLLLWRMVTDPSTIYLLHRDPAVLIPALRTETIRFKEKMQENNLHWIAIVDFLPHAGKLRSRNTETEVAQKLGLLAEMQADPKASHKSVFKLMKETIAMSQPAILAQVFDIFQDEGIEYRVAAYEADWQIAHMCRNPGNERYTAMSTDGDYVALQVPYIITDWDFSTGSATLITMGDSAYQALTDELLGEDVPVVFDAHFIRVMCIFVGNDYIPGVKGQGLQASLLRLKEIMTGKRSLEDSLIEIETKREWGTPGHGFKGPCKGYKGMFWRAYNLLMYGPVLHQHSFQLIPLEPFPDGVGWNGAELLGFDPTIQFAPYVGQGEKLSQGYFSKILSADGSLRDMRLDLPQQPKRDDGTLLPWNSKLNIWNKDKSVRVIDPIHLHEKALSDFLTSRSIFINLTDTKEKLVKLIRELMATWDLCGSDSHPAIMTSDEFDLFRHTNVGEIRLEKEIDWISNPDAALAMIRDPLLIEQFTDERLEEIGKLYDVGTRAVKKVPEMLFNFEVSSLSFAEASVTLKDGSVQPCVIFRASCLASLRNLTYEVEAVFTRGPQSRYLGPVSYSAGCQCEASSYMCYHQLIFLWLIVLFQRKLRDRSSQNVINMFPKCKLMSSVYIPVCLFFTYRKIIWDKYGKIV
jgi:hypothetical protein